MQHQPDLAIGVHLMDRYTFYLLEFLEDIQPASKTNMNDLVRVCVCVCVWTGPNLQYTGSVYSKEGSGSLLLFYLMIQVVGVSQLFQQ